MSGDLFTGTFLTGEFLSGDVISGSMAVTGSTQHLLGSPMVFWSWLWGIVKSVLLWCWGYWYVPVIIIVVYVLFLVGYNKFWGYLLSKLQKKDE